MAFIKVVAKRVFGCFRKMERFADRITGRAGPVFVSLAALLISLCVITYFAVIFPINFLNPDCNPLLTLLSLVISLYLAGCTGIHYYLACTIPPGSPSIGKNAQVSLSNPRSLLPMCFQYRNRWKKRTYQSYSRIINEHTVDPSRVDVSVSRYCTKCLKHGITGPVGRGPMKPERAHHCRICGICQLKYDHQLGIVENLESRV